VIAELDDAALGRVAERLEQCVGMAPLSKFQLNLMTSAVRPCDYEGAGLKTMWIYGRSRFWYAQTRSDWRKVVSNQLSQLPAREGKRITILSNLYVRETAT